MNISKLSKKLVVELEEIAIDLQDISPSDKSSLTFVGKALEIVLSDVSGSFAPVQELLKSCLAGFEQIENGSVKNVEGALKAIAETLLFIAKSSQSAFDNGLSEIQNQMTTFLDFSFTQSGSGASEELNTMDDIANMLIQLDEDSQSSEFEPIFSALKLHLEKSDFPDQINELVQQCIDLSDSIVNKKKKITSAKIDELGELLADIINHIEVFENTQKVKTVTASQAHTEENAMSTQEYPLPTDLDADILKDFIAESQEYLDEAESALLRLESDPKDSEAINLVFRAFHTIKGTSGFLQLDIVTSFAHIAENFLSKIRDGEVECIGGNADLALKSLDVVKTLIEAVEEALNTRVINKPDNYEEVLEQLKATEEGVLPEGGAAAAPAKEAAPAPTPVAEPAPAPTPEPVPAPAPVAEQPQPQQVRQEINQSIQKKQAPQKQAQQQSSSVAESSVRVRTDRLDGLIDMVGELVIANSMISQDELVINEVRTDFTRKVVHASKIVRELQDLSMSMRMIPLKSTFQKMARLVRDLSSKNNKKVNFLLQGEDTEIDRKMVELINDPLVHMVRNALDHGIEDPSERMRTGKSKVGTLRMSAFHASGNVIIKIQDDGRGINREKVIQKATSIGIVEPGAVLSDNEAYNLIFAPGFSTAEKITDISGRGVGMDVVRRNIESLRGRIDIESKLGKGTTFTLTFPLTIAIIDGMLVKVGDERYIIPIVNIQMSLRPTQDALYSVAKRGEMVMFQGELIPISRLHKSFSIDGAVEDPTEGLLVIVGDKERRCAILVDELLGQQQVVTKSLGEEMGEIKGISGGAILGDGRVGLILDSTEIVAMAKQNADNVVEAVV